MPSSQRDLEVGTRELAASLYDSLFHKLLRLPPAVRVYPAHGAGSLCGQQISSTPFANHTMATAINGRADLIPSGETIRPAPA
jgi:hypothetical protein